jgi:uncharacterized membrane protein
MLTALQEKPAAETLPTMTGAATILDGRYVPPPEDKDGKMWVRTSAMVQVEPQVLYDLWSDIEHIPAWQEEILEVRRTGPTTSHWVMQSGEKRLEWTAEILADEPGKRIAWHSTGGDIDQAGEVIFEPQPAGRGTMVTVLQEFHMGKLASAWQTLVGRNPKQGVVENLRHFKALAETGEVPRAHPQPHGPRGTVGEVKRSLFGEKIPVPAGVR